MQARRVLIIGGTGFVGRAVAARLATANVRLCLPTRRRARAAASLILPAAEVVEADVHDPITLRALMQGQDAVINLVGILHSRSGSPWGPDFQRAHVELPQKIVAACIDAGISRLVHISALGAGSDAPSQYQRSKAAGEAAIKSAPTGLEWTILQPSVIFGREDSFLNLFADLLALFPLMPLAGANTRFQPVYIEDVAEVVARCLGHGPHADAQASIGQTFELAGPKVYTLRQLVEYVGTLTGHRRPVLPLPEALGMLQALMLECLPNPPMSRDNVRSMRADNVARGTPLPFGLKATALESIAPLYLGNAAPAQAQNAFRKLARR